MTDADALAASFLRRVTVLLERLGKGVETSCAPDPPDGHVFLAEATADTPVGRVRIIFGDREFEVRTSIHPTGRPWPIALAFYLDAMGQDSSKAKDAMWIHSENRLAHVLEAQEEALRECLGALRPDPVVLWRKADALRLGEEEEYRERMRYKEMVVAVGRAADAFRDDDLARVIALLTPYEDILSEAQMTKLRLARERHDAHHG